MSVRLHGAQEVRGSVCRINTITFLRASCGGLGLSLMVASALPGCAPTRPPVPPPQTLAAPAEAAYATVAAVRPVPVVAPGASDPDTAILTAMGVSQTAKAAGAAPAEVILRRDDGETLSVIQPVGIGLAPGDRVMVLPGGHPRLVTAPPQS